MNSSSGPGAFGPYRVLHQVGAGVLGPVFRAYHPDDDRPFCVKALRLDLTPEQVERLVEALAKVADAGPVHPGLVLPAAAGNEGGTPWFAARYIAAESLDAPARPAAAAGDSLALLAQLAAAIDAAHARGLRHGGLHPRDILAGADAPCVTGFGIVPALERAGLPGPARRPYTAPEMLAGHGWGPEADRYALAAVACELLAGRRAEAAREQVAAALGSAGGKSPMETLRDVLAAALDADPARRPPSAAAIVAELGEALGVAPAAAGAAPNAPGAADARPAEPAPAAVTVAPATAVVAASEDAAAEPADDTAAGAVTIREEPAPAAAAPEQPQLDLLDIAARDVATPYAPEVSPGPDELSPLPPAAPRERAGSAWWPVAVLTLAVLALTAGAAAYLAGYRFGGETPPSAGGARTATPAVQAPAAVSVAPAAHPAPRPAASVAPAPVATPRSAPAPADDLPQPAPAPPSAPAAAAPPPSSPAPAPAAPPAAAAVAAPAPDAQAAPPAFAPAPDPPAPAAATGWVLVRTAPLGATVLVDGAERGRTPLSLQDVPLGRRVVEVRREGFRPVTREVLLSAAEPVAAIGLELSPLAAAGPQDAGAAR